MHTDLLDHRNIDYININEVIIFGKWYTINSILNLKFLDWQFFPNS